MVTARVTANLAKQTADYVSHEEQEESERRFREDGERNDW